LANAKWSAVDLIINSRIAIIEQRAFEYRLTSYKDHVRGNSGEHATVTPARNRHHDTATCPRLIDDTSRINRAFRKPFESGTTWRSSGLLRDGSLFLGLLRESASSPAPVGVVASPSFPSEANRYGIHPRGTSPRSGRRVSADMDEQSVVSSQEGMDH